MYTGHETRFVVLDWETTNIDKGSALNTNNSIVLGCWKVVDRKAGTAEMKWNFGDEYSQHELLTDIAQADFVVAHNAKFEAQWLKRCGVDLRKLRVYCTMLGQWVLNGNLQGPLGLDALGHDFFGDQKDSLVTQMIKNGVCPSEIPRDLLFKYCVKDVHLCHLLFEKQSRELEAKGLSHIALTRNLTCLVLADIEFEGMTLDPVRVRQEYIRVVDERAECEQGLNKLTGGINLGSSKQLGEYLYKTLRFKPPRDHKGKPITTASGKPSTATSTLNLLHPTTEDQKRFLELYRRFNKVESLLTKNLEFFKRVCDERDCSFTARFNQAVTKTHRLSSSGMPILFEGEKKPKSVQFQNLPRQYKSLFWAGDEDWLIGEADGAQLEFRVAADLGNDTLAQHEIGTWTDIHAITAETLTRAGEPTSRQGAKASTFAPLYGGNGKTPAQQAYAKFFKEKYKGISSTQRDWCYQVLDRKELVTPYGMRYYWPGCKISKSGYIEHTTEIHNFPVQGFATAEIIPIALVHFWLRAEPYNIKVLNTVHDSIVAKFPKDEQEVFTDLARQALTTDVFNYLREVYSYDFTTPLGVGLKVARNWGDTKEELTINMWPDGRQERKQ